MAARFAKPTETEIVALLETQNKKKTTKYGEYNKTIIPLAGLVMS